VRDDEDDLNDEEEEEEEEDGGGVKECDPGVDVGVPIAEDE